ncbi:hypothetical protein GCM10027511_03260 [Hymenobacter humi]
MDVGIKHARHKNATPRVDDAGTLGNGEAFADLLNYSFDKQDIALDKHG